MYENWYVMFQQAPWIWVVMGILLIIGVWLIALAVMVAFTPPMLLLALAVTFITTPVMRLLPSEDTSNDWFFAERPHWRE